MKKWVIIIMIFVFMTGCSKSNKIKYEDKIDNHESVVMFLKDGTLTSTSATIIIKNKVKKEWIFNIGFSIEKKENDTWVPLDTKNSENTWTLKKYILEQDDEIEFYQNWEEIYGNLDIGEYRLIKYAVDSTNDEISYFALNFKIDF